jgi:hypothetical protein
MEFAVSGPMFPKKKHNRPTLPTVRRTAGQSLRDEKERLCDNRLTAYVWVPFFFWIVCLVEFAHAWTHQPPMPWFWLCMALTVTLICGIGFLRLIPKFQRLNRGERGELCVAEVLEELRGDGYKPFHDLKRDGFNIDHVVVGPAGVFAIETKFRSGQGEITFRNGEGLFVDGFPEEKDSLKQARSNAREVNRLIQETCGINEWVKPVVVFVGEWKVKNAWWDTDARVFTIDTLNRYIVNQQPRLTRSEIKLIASHLERSAKS